MVTASAPLTTRLSPAAVTVPPSLSTLASTTNLTLPGTARPAACVVPSMVSVAPRALRLVGLPSGYVSDAEKLSLPRSDAV